MEAADIIKEDVTNSTSPDMQKEVPENIFFPNIKFLVAGILFGILFPISNCLKTNKKQVLIQVFLSLQHQYNCLYD